MNDTKTTQAGERTRTIRKGDLRIELDGNQIDRKDPGQGTPAMVYKGTRFNAPCSTFWCAIEQGELDDCALTDDELNWLNEQEPTVSAWLDGQYEQLKAAGLNGW